MKNSAEAEQTRVASRPQRGESAQQATEVCQPPIVVAFAAGDSAFVPTARGGAREAIFRPPTLPREARGGNGA